MLLGCNRAPAKHAARSGDTVRYLLPLRNNPVSSSDAAHCFVGCQSTSSPKEYVDCLSACPGFEITPGEACSEQDRPPEAACLTVRKIPAKNEPPPGAVVIAIIGEMALIVGAVSLCQVSSSQCGLYPPPR